MRDYNRIKYYIVVNLNGFRETVRQMNELYLRIDGLEGGHNHPKWMRKLGLVKD